MSRQLGPLTAERSIFKDCSLWFELVKRDLSLRYQGSLLGALWVFLSPLLMLFVYTFVFSVVFEVKWETKIENKADFALILFCGLTAFNIFAETVSRCPTVISNNPNFVKKVVFPLHLLPLSVLGTAVVNGLVGIGIIITANWIINGFFLYTFFLFPLVLIPLLLMSIGIGLFLASLGVFIRDIAQLIPLITTALLFLSPIFYPVEAVPSQFHFIFKLNPISATVEDLRKILLWGEVPDWRGWVFGLVEGIVIFACGALWFRETKRGFADVL